MYSNKIEAGWSAPDFELPDTLGNIYNLKHIAPKKGLLILFTCNHCPYAKASWPVIIGLHKKFKDKGFDFVAINSNDDSVYPEDSLEVMKQKVVDWKIPFPYLRDETQTVAKDYQAQCTPDVYLFDQDKKLFYHGRINDNWQDSANVTRHDLDEALRRMFIGDRPPVEQFPSMGCSIKWKV